MTSSQMISVVVFASLLGLSAYGIGACALNAEESNSALNSAALEGESTSVVANSTESEEKVSQPRLFSPVLHQSYVIWLPAAAASVINEQLLRMMKHSLRFESRTMMRSRNQRAARTGRWQLRRLEKF